MIYQLFYTESLWLKIAIVSVLYTLGHIFLGHFEEVPSCWKKFLKDHHINQG